MRKIGLFFILLLVIPIVAAIDTPITIKTLPYYTVNIFVLDPSQVYSSIQSFYENSGYIGEVNVTANSSLANIDIRVMIKKDDTLILSDTTKGYTAGQPIILSYLVNNTEESASAPVADANTSTANNTGATGKSTGAIVSSVRSILTKRNLYIILGVIFGLGVISFLVFFVFNRKGKGEIRVVKMQDKMKQQEEKKVDEGSNELTKAQRKLIEAQEEVNRLKYRDKIKEMERTIDDLKDNLRKLGA